MAKRSTRDAALSRLFGNVAEESSSPPRSESEDPEGPPKKPTASPEALLESDGSDSTARPREVKAGGGEAKKSGRASGPVEEPASGYIGLGRYSRADGIVERITPYVRPDQAEALRIAVARKNDPRGTDVSQIIQSLLDEAGYSG